MKKHIKEMNINFLVYFNYYSCITALNTPLVDPQCICTKTKDDALHVHCSRPRTKHSKLLMLPALLEIELLQWVTLLCDISSVWNSVVLKLQCCSFCSVFLLNSVRLILCWRFSVPVLHPCSCIVTMTILKNTKKRGIFANY